LGIGEISMRVISVAFTARWGEPICFVQREEVTSIAGPADAIRHMRENFIKRTGPTYTRAVDVLFAALRREADLDIAKVFFLAACEDDRMRTEVFEAW